MQRKQQHNLKKFVILAIFFIACSIIIGVAATDSTAEETTSAESTAPAQPQSDKQTVDNSILELTNKFKTLTVAYNDKPGVNYKTLIENSIDANIAAKALLDQANGFIKIAEFKKDYEIVPDKKVLQPITPEDEKAGIRIMKFEARIEDKKLLLDSEFQVLNKQKDYSINYMIGSPPEYPTQDYSASKDLIFSDENSEQIYAKSETGQIRFSKKIVLFDTLKRRFFDTSKGIDKVELRVYDKLKVTGDPTKLDEKGEKAEVEWFVTSQTLSLTEEAQEITRGKDTKFTPEFFPANKLLVLTTKLDGQDGADFYYQFEFNTAKGKVLFPEKRLSKAEMLKNEGKTAVNYNYLGIDKQSDVKSIKLNVYTYSTQDKPIYYKEEDLTAKTSTASGIACTTCNDDNVCTFDECQGLSKDNCVWIPDKNLWLSAKDLIGVGSYNTISNANQESGMCKEKKSVSKKEECTARCKSRTCDTADKKTSCTVDTKCVTEGDKCIPNPDYGTITTTTTISTTSIKNLQQLKSRYGQEITAAAQDSDVPESLIYAILASESSNNQNFVSSTGATGLMQIIYSTARAYDVNCETKYPKIKCSKKIFEKLTDCSKNCDTSKDDRFIPEKSILAGAWILRDKTNLFEGYKAQQELGIASYNAGEKYAGDAVKTISDSKTMTWGELVKAGIVIKHPHGEDGVAYAKKVLAIQQAAEQMLAGKIPSTAAGTEISAPPEGATESEVLQFVYNNYGRDISAAAEKYEVEPALLYAVILGTSWGNKMFISEDCVGLIGFCLDNKPSYAAMLQNIQLCENENCLKYKDKDERFNAQKSIMAAAAILAKSSADIGEIQKPVKEGRESMNIASLLTNYQPLAIIAHSPRAGGITWDNTVKNQLEPDIVDLVEEILKYKKGAEELLKDKVDGGQVPVADLGYTPPDIGKEKGEIDIGWTVLRLKQYYGSVISEIINMVNREKNILSEDTMYAILVQEKYNEYKTNPSLKPRSDLNSQYVSDEGWYMSATPLGCIGLIPFCYNSVSLDDVGGVFDNSLIVKCDIPASTSSNKETRKSAEQECLKKAIEAKDGRLVKSGGLTLKAAILLTGSKIKYFDSTYGKDADKLGIAALIIDKEPIENVIIRINANKNSDDGNSASSWNLVKPSAEEILNKLTPEDFRQSDKFKTGWTDKELNDKKQETIEYVGRVNRVKNLINEQQIFELVTSYLEPPDVFAENKQAISPEARRI